MRDTRNHLWLCMVNPTVKGIQQLGENSTQTHRDNPDVLRHIIKNVYYYRVPLGCLRRDFFFPQDFFPNEEEGGEPENQCNTRCVLLRSWPLWLNCHSYLHARTRRKDFGLPFRARRLRFFEIWQERGLGPCRWNKSLIFFFVLIKTRVVMISPFGRSPAYCLISRLRFAFSRLRFVWVSPGVVCGAGPGSGLC